MRRALRWLVRIVVGLLALAVVVVAVVVIALHTAWGRNLVRGKVETALQTAFPGTKIGSLTGSVFGTLVLHDIELVALDHRPLARIKTLEVQVALLPLFGHTARVELVRATDVEAYPRPIPPTPDDGSPPSAWTIELPRIEVHGAQVILETAGVTLADVDLAAAATIRAGGALTAVAQVGGTFDGRAFGGTAAVTVDDEIRVPFAALGVGQGQGQGYIVASDVALGARRGHLIGQVPAADLAARAPMVPIRGDALVLASATPHERETTVVLSAAIGASRLDAVALVDPATRHVRGLVGTRGVDLATVTGDRLAGNGRAVIAAVTDGDHVQATVIAGGAVRDLPASHLVLAIDGRVRLDRVEVLAFATAEGGVRIGAVAAVTREGRAVRIDRAQLGATVIDPVVASGGRAPVRGAASIEGSAAGPLSALVVVGKVSGSRLGFERISVARLAGRFRASLDATLTGTAHVELAGVVNAGQPVGAAVVDARRRDDGKLEVRTRVRAAAAPVVADVSAVVTLGTIIDVALGRHRLETPAGLWTGNGGRVRIAPRTISVQGIRTAQGDAWAKIDATLGRGNGAIAATIDAAIEAHGLPVAAIDPRYGGTVNAALSLSRERGRWSGGGLVSGTALALGAGLPMLDAGATVNVVGRRVTLGVNASNEALGGARIAIEVDGPKDLLDRVGWRKVARADLHAVTIGLDQVDASALSKGKTAGKLDGTVEIREGVPSGAVRVRGVPTPIGDADADLTLALTDVGFVDARAKAQIGAVGAATLGARLAIPDHPFDPAAWKALGTRVVDGATAEVTGLVIDPKLLSAFHVMTPYRGTASVRLELGAGATSANIVADLANITGGPLARGIDVHVEGTADAQGTRGALRVGAGATTLAALPDAAIPITLATWIAAPRSALAAPVSGTLALGSIGAKEALALVGRSDVISGSIAGSIAIHGTLGTPTATGTLDALDVRVAPRFSTRPPPALTRLHVGASWGGAGGEIRITGEEEGKGTLEVDVRGSPRELASVFARIQIERFDLAPVVVFLPGPLAGASGTLAADLTLTGADPVTGKLRGTLGLSDGRVPISPVIGTLRKANATLAINDAGLEAKLDGKLGAGSVKVTASSEADGLLTTIDAKLTKVSPIGALQPILDATVHGSFRRSGMQWDGEVRVSKGSIEVPSQGGTELLDAAVPADLIFVDLPIPRLPFASRAPEHPWLVAHVQLDPMLITVPEFAVDAVARGKVAVAVGETVGLEGELRVERGSADLFGHRYRVELGQIVFDGTTDGLLDLKLAHDFSDLTTFVRFAGRMSELSGQEPEFSSEPGLYSQGQLLGFFLGGEPGGDPSKQTREAAAGFGAALASSKIGKRLKEYLPIGLDVLRCDPGAGTTGASCTLGTWLTHEVFLSYKQRLEARYDENSGEGAVEWHFRPSWELDLSGGDRNYYGGDLLWRRRW